MEFTIGQTFKKPISNCLEDAEHREMLEKSKSKLQGISLHLSEWPSSKKATNHKGWRECGVKGNLLHPPLVGMEIGNSRCGEQYGGSLKSKTRASI